MIKIGITGHRHLENPEEVKQQVYSHLLKIKSENSNAVLEAWSSLAKGADSIFASCALELQIPLKVVLPFAAAEYEKDFDGKDLPEFRSLLQQSAETYVAEKNTPAANTEARNEAYKKAGYKIVDTCNILMVVWDGQEARGTGGTATIKDYAESLNKQVIYIDAYRSEISHLFIEKDKLANAEKKKYEALWMTGLFCSLAAAIIFAFSQSFPSGSREYLLAGTELTFALLALVCVIILRVYKINKKRTMLRREAERLRLLEKLHSACLSVDIPKEYDADISPEIVLLEKKYNVQKCELVNAGTAKVKLLELIKEQVNYHRNIRPELKGKKLYKSLEASRLLLLLLFITGVFIHFIEAYLKTYGSAHDTTEVTEYFFSFGLMLTLTMPAVYAAVEGFVQLKEYHKVFWYSEYMLKIFERVQADVNSISPGDTGAIDQLNKQANELFREMDNENRVWYLVMFEKDTPGAV